ncbi:HU family DNA-binding protein [Pseudomonas tolaasii]|uniref:HU family DNA-binding protein n=1 Tax=Pseudomonas tolaasii TaxID=29442 RepID=UPI001C5E1524|nr:HU family DNA-binding protein [Pseudomonas tolaasii]MBW4793190.1 HU family DNA-binding protein [Pseudomonas tolaasii]
MNKNDLIETTTRSTDFPKPTAGHALEALTTLISTALQSGENVTFVGYDTFAVKACATRDGHPLQTRATTKIAAAKAPSLKGGISRNDAVS